MSKKHKKLVIIGDRTCGRTSLLHAFTKDIFPTEPTRNAFQNNCEPYKIEIDGTLIDLVIWDIVGPEDYEWMRPLFYPYTDAMLIAFSIDLPDTLQFAIDILVPEVKKDFPKVPIILIGNKKDLRYDSDTIRKLKNKNQEPVRVEEGEAVAEKIGAHAYLECSAKTREGVREVFEVATKAALQFKRKSKHNCFIL